MTDDRSAKGFGSGKGSQIRPPGHTENAEDRAMRVYAAIEGILRDAKELKRLTVGDDGLGLAAGMTAQMGLEEVGEGAWRPDSCQCQRVDLARLAQAEGVTTQDLLREAVELLMKSRA